MDNDVKFPWPQEMNYNKKDIYVCIYGMYVCIHIYKCTFMYTNIDIHICNVSNITYTIIEEMIRRKC